MERRIDALICDARIFVVLDKAKGQKTKDVPRV
jgi:hypothetical protein